MATSEPREIIRRTVENDHLNNQRARDYTYVQRQETHYLAKNGGVKSTSPRGPSQELQPGCRRHV